MLACRLVESLKALRVGGCCPSAALRGLTVFSKSKANDRGKTKVNHAMQIISLLEREIKTEEPATSMVQTKHE